MLVTVSCGVDDSTGDVVTIIHPVSGNQNREQTLVKYSQQNIQRAKLDTMTGIILVIIIIIRIEYLNGGLSIPHPRSTSLRRVKGRVILTYACFSTTWCR